MKKRITCLLMALILLVGLAPMSVLTANAASRSVSEAAINILKSMTQFRGECYQVSRTDDFRIGYGTVCDKDHTVDREGNWTKGEDEPHTISQTAADEALRAALKQMDTKVNSFASSNGLSLSQNQHDALVLFSYNSGVAWMDGTSVVKTAIVGGVDANTLLNAMCQWTNNADIDRRKVEVNMYVNGVYSVMAPTSYGYVIYHPNGGTMAQDDGNGTYKMYYDTTKTVAHDPVPTSRTDTFLGWYRSGSGGYQWRPSLTADCNGWTLYALWQPRNQAASDNAGHEVYYTMSRSSLASRTVYSLPDVSSDSCKVVGTVSATSFTVLRDYIGTDGSRWAKLGNGQWVIVKAGSNGTGTGTSDIDVTVTVTNSYVNMRENATIFSRQNGSWKKGSQLRILTTESADGFLWGQVATSDENDTPIGWVALKYTNWNDVKDGGSTSGSGSSDTTASTDVVARAVITVNGYVNIRSDAGTDNKIVGSLGKNDTVDIYEIKTVDGHQWGRTSAGWICLSYASLTMTGNTNAVVSDEGALAYSFTGKLVKSDLMAHVQPGYDTNLTGGKLAVNTEMTITNLTYVGTTLWGKVVWRVDTNNDGVKDTNKTGWLEIKELSTSGDPIAIDTARFKVVSDVKIKKDQPGSASETLFTLTPGVEFTVEKITLMDEGIWGFTSDIVFVTDDMTTSNYGYTGWVNLASKYVERMDAPTISGNTTVPNTGMMATVINTDSVRVRNTGSTTYGKVIGSLKRGATVAVWETNEGGDWYKVDSNQNGVYDYEEDGWVYGQYLNVYGPEDSTTSGSGTTTGGTSTTGTGIVANTYSGVNVRTGAGTAYPSLGKLQPGTQVQILETTTVGATKWGRMSQGWVCMDYISMMTYDQIPGNTTPSGNGTAVGDLDSVDKTTTTAIYTGSVKSETVNVYATTSLASGTLNPEEIVRVMNKGDRLTIYELITVTELVATEEGDKTNAGGTGDSAQTEAGGSTTVTTVVSYWARVNDGYIYYPEQNISLDALDEKVHTLTGADALKIRDTAGGAVIGELKKGDQVSVTALQIIQDKVWGRIDTPDIAGASIGWIRLDYMAEGAYYVQQNSTGSNSGSGSTTATTAPTIGSIGNTGAMNGATGYKYTGKVINTNSVNVRSIASTTGTVTTTLSSGQSLVIYETTISDNMAWGRCDAGWVYLYYVDLTPATGTAIDARVVYNDNTIIYSDSAMSTATGSTYARMSVIDIYEVVGTMARTDLGWVKTTDLL